MEIWLDLSWDDVMIEYGESNDEDFNIMVKKWIRYGTQIGELTTLGVMEEMLRDKKLTLKMIVNMRDGVVQRLTLLHQELFSTEENEEEERPSDSDLIRKEIEKLK